MTPVSIASLFGSEEAFEEAFRQAYIEAGLSMLCEIPKGARP